MLTQAQVLTSTFKVPRWADNRGYRGCTGELRGQGGWGDDDVGDGGRSTMRAKRGGNEALGRRTQAGVGSICPDGEIGENAFLR